MREKNYFLQVILKSFGEKTIRIKGVSGGNILS